MSCPGGFITDGSLTVAALLRDARSYQSRDRYGAVTKSPGQITI
jgi:hypothetical protein